MSRHSHCYLAADIGESIRNLLFYLEGNNVVRFSTWAFGVAPVARHFRSNLLRKIQPFFSVSPLESHHPIDPNLADTFLHL